MPHTQEIPKPLLEVAGRPVLAHVMEIYARQGFCDFVLAAGFKADLVRAFASSLPMSWDVEVVDTGEDANTGLRVARCLHLLGSRFSLTYCDGLADIDLSALLAFHESHRGMATLTSVPLPSQYGTIDRDDNGRVTAFCEKPRLEDHWINAGFCVFDQGAASYVTKDDLEREVLPLLAAAGQLYAYRHRGFWRSMDTFKDCLELSALCRDGTAPWVSPAAVTVGIPG